MRISRSLSQLLGRVALAAIALLYLSRGAIAQTTFEAAVSRNQVGLGETFVYEVTLSLQGGDGENYQRPDFRSLRMLGESPSQSTQLQIGGGGSFMQTTYTWRYELQATTKGNVAIGPARVRAAGRDLRTSPITINVGNAAPSTGAAPSARTGQVPGAGTAAVAAGGSGSFVRAVPDKLRAYLGEQITVEWQLYLTARQDKYQTTTEPRTDGFWTEEIPLPENQRGLNLTQVEYEGRAYLTAPLLKRALFPLAPGRLTISPLESEISQVNFFGATARTERLQAEPVTIEVLPLPLAGRPPGFDSASVGNFSLTARVDRPAVTAGEAVTLTLVIAGQGNLRKLQAPKLPGLSGWKSYEPKVTLALQTAPQVGGQKTVEFLLLPERPGTTIIPAFELPVFDPATGTYKVEKTAPLRIEVTGDVAAATPAAGADNARAGAAPTGTAIENVLPAQIRPPRSRPTLGRDLGTTFYRSSFFLGVLVLPPLALGLVVVLGGVRQRLSQETERGRRRKRRRSVQRRLGAAETHMQAGRDAPFFIEIERVLRESLAAQLGRQVTGLSQQEVRAALVSKGFAAQLGDAIVVALEACDQARFAPGSSGPEVMRTALDRVGDIILQLNRSRARGEGAS